jgi:hypothetical protein
MVFTGLKTAYIDEAFKGEQKFVISRQPTGSERLYLFNFYGVDLWPGYHEEPRHEKIVQGFEIRPEDVIGGGRVKRPSLNEILLYGSSGTYGAVPKKFIEHFKNEILRGYQEKIPGIENVLIDTPEKTDNDNKVSFLDQFLGGK